MELAVLTSCRGMKKSCSSAKERQRFSLIWGRKGKRMERQLLTAQELKEVLGVSESQAYAFIRTMNEELQAKGFLTVRGRIPAAYVRERFFFGEESDESAR